METQKLNEMHKEKEQNLEELSYSMIDQQEAKGWTIAIKVMNGVQKSEVHPHIYHS